MLSHEPKNYALLDYGGALHLRGVAFRSSRAEPFGEAFLRRALARLLVGDVTGVREAYLDAVSALRRHALPTRDVTSRVRLTKTPSEYLETREQRRELPYEALINQGRISWRAGERVRVYRTQTGDAGTLVDVDTDDDADAAGAADARDYDVDHYVGLLRETFAARLVRAFTPDDFAAVFADPDQLSLFPPALDAIRPILSRAPAVTVAASASPA
jgi:DNA polymerase elongation subunit (family B)